MLISAYHREIARPKGPENSFPWPFLGVTFPGRHGQEQKLLPREVTSSKRDSSFWIFAGARPLNGDRFSGLTERGGRRGGGSEKEKKDGVGIPVR